MAAVIAKPIDFAPNSHFTPQEEHIEDGNQLTPRQLSALRAPTVPEGVDPTTQQLAYGRRGVPKLIETLVSPKSTLFKQQQSLCFLAELFHRPEHISLGLDEGIVGKLGALVGHEDLTIRQKSSECLRIIAGHAVGRAGIVQAHILTHLSQRVHLITNSFFNQFEDPDVLVRKNVHETLGLVTLDASGALAVLSGGLFASLIAKLPYETLDVQIHVIATCHNCIRLGQRPLIPASAVDCGAMEVFTKMLRVGCASDVLVGVGRCVMAFSDYHEGKRLAVQHDTVVVLLTLLHHRRSEVRAAVAGALMSITIDVEGKRLVVRGNSLQVLSSLLKDRNELVLLNVVKTITNCAEDYRGRFQLHGCIKQLQTITESPNTQLAEAAKRAIEVITWRP
ncbi:armadillo-type protein [Powellomyces hirtus]|nr:armadillo-type protein [Powellomyces hirtus]